MDYEEKYKEALERMKSWVRGEHPECFCEAQKAAEFIFPELKEDNDERIRKGLIKAVSRTFEGNKLFDTDVTREEALAWLEKQDEPKDKGEISDGYHTFNELYRYRMLYNAAFFNLLPKELVHKSKRHHDGEECFGGGWFIVMANLPTGQISNHYELKDWDLFQIPEKEIADEWDGHTPQEAAERLHKYLLEKQGKQTADKVEPKFKVGDWIANGGANPCYVKSIFGDYYELCSCEGFEYTKHIIDVDYIYHLWTINDANDGDVLAYATDEGDSWAMIYRSLYEPYEGHVHYHALLVNDNFSDKGTCCICIDNLKPATKEQRELLFSKMKEAGYEWDADKKELKKMEVASKESEDEKIIRELCDDIDLYVPTPERYIAWLEKQGEKFTAIDVDKMVFEYSTTEDGDFGFPINCMIRAYRKGINDALKLLKERVTWKPSKEQIAALRWVLNNVPYTKHKEEINGLLDQIKDL